MEKEQNDLALFMVKKAKERAGKKSQKLTLSNLIGTNKDSNENAANEKPKSDEEIAKEEELEEAKKASKHKAAQYDQSDMIKKLILQNIIKYVVIIGSLVIFAVGVIKLGPVIGSMLNGLIFDIFMSDMK